MKSLDEDLLGELEEISDRADQRRDEIEWLEAELEQQEDRIAEDGPVSYEAIVERLGVSTMSDVSKGAS